MYFPDEIERLVSQFLVQNIVICCKAGLEVVFGIVERRGPVVSRGRTTEVFPIIGEVKLTTLPHSTEADFCLDSS